MVEEIETGFLCSLSQLQSLQHHPMSDQRYIMGHLGQAIAERWDILTTQGPLRLTHTKQTPTHDLTVLGSPAER